jgi:hypothetical protein
MEQVMVKSCIKCIYFDECPHSDNWNFACGDMFRKSLVDASEYDDILLPAAYALAAKYCGEYEDNPDKKQKIYW